MYKDEDFNLHPLPDAILLRQGYVENTSFGGYTCDYQGCVGMERQGGPGSAVKYVCMFQSFVAHK